MTASECIFCRIVAGEIPSTVVYEDETVMAIRDIQPVAPTHVLVLPRAHIESVHSADLDGDTVVALIRAAQLVAEHEGLEQDGYRLVTNVGEYGGQTVPHLHWHVLGGRALASMG